MPRRRKLRPIPGRPNEFVDVGAPKPADVIEAFMALSVRDQWLVLLELRKVRAREPGPPMMPACAKPAKTEVDRSMLVGKVRPPRKQAPLPRRHDNLITRVIRGEVSREELRALANGRKDVS